MNDNKDKIMDTLRNYWEDKKQNAPYPLAEDMDQLELAGIWDDCFLIRVENKNFIYEYAGTNICSGYAEELQGKLVVEDMLYPESPELIGKLNETMRFCQPLEYEGAFINKENEDIKFRKLLLPLGEGNQVGFIIGAMRWRGF